MPKGSYNHQNYREDATQKARKPLDLYAQHVAYDNNNINNYDNNNNNNCEPHSLSGEATHINEVLVFIVCLH